MEKPDLPHITRVSAKGRDWLAMLEGGYRLKAYLDPVGVWTISAGVTRYPSGDRVKMGDVLGSDQEAVRLFQGILSPFEANVDGLTIDTLTQAQFDAVVSFAYNIGWPSLAKSTLLKYINTGWPQPAVENQWMRWVYGDADPKHPGLEIMPGLVARRKAEWLCYSRGTYKLQYQV